MKLLTVLAIVFLLLALTVATLQRKGAPSRRPIRSRLPLTLREQPMYFRLRAAFPEHVVLAQVAFSALLTTSGRATRNSFDRKVADFVLCSRAFAVLAVIELDDSSHHGKRLKDASRDALLTAAGYKVLRFAQIPDEDQLRKALTASGD